MHVLNHCGRNTSCLVMVPDVNVDVSVANPALVAEPSAPDVDEPDEPDDEIL